MGCQPHRRFLLLTQPSLIVRALSDERDEPSFGGLARNANGPADMYKLDRTGIPQAVNGRTAYVVRLLEISDGNKCWHVFVLACLL